MVKNIPANAGDSGSIPGAGRSPGEGTGTHSSIPGTPTDQGAWRATLRRVDSAVQHYLSTAKQPRASGSSGPSSPAAPQALVGLWRRIDGSSRTPPPTPRLHLPRWPWQRRWKADAGGPLIRRWGPGCLQKAWGGPGKGAWRAEPRVWNAPAAQCIPYGCGAGGPWPSAAPPLGLASPALREGTFVCARVPSVSPPPCAGKWSPDHRA